MAYYILTAVKKIQKIGNSLMVSISPYQAEKMGLKAGDKVWVTVEGPWDEPKKIAITKERPERKV